MQKSTRKLSYIILAILVTGLMGFTLAFTPMAFSRDGGGGRGGFRGSSGGGGSFGGGRSSGGGFRSSPRTGSMPSGRSTPSYTAPRAPMRSSPGVGRTFGGQPGSARSYSAQPRTPSRTVPNIGAPSYRGRVPSVTPPPSGRTGQGSSVRGRQSVPAISSGAGPQAGRPGIQGERTTPRSYGQVRPERTQPRPGTVTTPSTPRQPERGMRTPQRVPGTTERGEFRRTPGTQGQVSPYMRRGERRFEPGEVRRQWNNDRERHHGEWHHNGDWRHDDHWDWNDSSISFGLFFYPGFSSPFDYGYWGFGDCGAYCSFSPFYYYGLPYVYAPRVAVANVPVYTYNPVPTYSYGGGYYLSQGVYSGLNAAIDDIRFGWINNRPDLILQHINAGTQIAIYLDNDYAYSLSGADYRDMVKDAIGRIRTVNFNINNVEQRSDGAYTVSGTHEFYDINNNYNVVDISYTFALQGGNWVIVAAGSSRT